MEKLKPDATGIYVAAHQAPAAIEEAIEAEVPLVVAVAEHIPIHAILRVSVLEKHVLHRLTTTDTLYAEDTIEIKICRGQCSRNYLSHWEM